MEKLNRGTDLTSLQQVFRTEFSVFVFWRKKVSEDSCAPYLLCPSYNVLYDENPPCLWEYSVLGMYR